MVQINCLHLMIFSPDRRGSSGVFKNRRIEQKNN